MRQKRNLIAIGDIHGMISALEILISCLEEEFLPEDTRFVFLGDIIDRGLDSMKAVNLVCDTCDRFPESILVRGNHDLYIECMSNLSIARDETAAWMASGGRETFASYGLKADDMIEAGKQFNRSHPRHVSLFQKARSHFQTDRYFFTHAGIDPSVPLQEQDDHDMMWIRDGFLDYSGAFEKIVVHGHTITKSELPEIHQNRIALDTGSYRTGRIAAAVFVDDQVTGFIVSEATKCGDKIMRFDENMRTI